MRRPYPRARGASPYPKLIAFLESDIGQVWDADTRNIVLIAAHMEWSTSQVRSVISVLARKGVLQLVRGGPLKRWQVVQQEEAAA